MPVLCDDDHPMIYPAKIINNDRMFLGKNRPTGYRWACTSLMLLLHRFNEGATRRVAPVGVAAAAPAAAAAPLLMLFVVALLLLSWFVLLLLFLLLPLRGDGSSWPAPPPRSPLPPPPPPPFSPAPPHANGSKTGARPSPGGPNMLACGRFPPSMGERMPPPPPPNSANRRQVPFQGSRGVRLSFNYWVGSATSNQVWSGLAWPDLIYFCFVYLFACFAFMFRVYAQ